VAGAAVVIDVRSGEVLAMASRPTFDPNGFSRGWSQAEWDAVQGRDRPFFHRAIQARYPPASTFKNLTLYAGYDRDLVGPNSLLDPCWGGWQFGNRFFRCWRAAGHGKMTGEEALAHSCDTYFYQLGAELGVTGIREYADRFRITEPTGIDIPGESRGFVPDRAWYNENYGVRGWSGGVALNLSIGQGEILLTPLQLAVFTGVVATGGERVTPRLLLQAEGDAPEASSLRDLELDTRLLAEVRRGMKTAVVSGTAQSVRFSEVTAAAKTGTAETGTLENRGADNAVFVAYAPAEDPQVALAVYLEGRGHGGAAAGPVARRILAAAFHIPFNEDEMVLVEGD
jgi:penicillin-binding protein 2